MSINSANNARLSFTPEMAEMFDRLYDSHLEGRFKAMLLEKNVSMNMVKSKMWDSFTAAFNRVILCFSM